jgi:hypothetical protein
MIFALTIAGGLLLVFGLLVGWSLAEAALSQRARRQAEFQRRLVEQYRTLREHQALIAAYRHGAER